MCKEKKNHCHLEVAKGAFTGTYYQKNSQGVYILPNQISPDKAFVIDGTVLINNGQTSGSGNKMSWKTASQVGSSSTSSGTTSTSAPKFSSMEKETYGIRYTHSQVNIRKDSPDGTVVGYTEEGDEFTYTRKCVWNGYRYIGFYSEQFKCNVVIAWNTEDRNNPWAVLCDPSEFKKSTTTKTESTTKTETKSYEESLDDPEQPDLNPEVLESQHGLTINVSLVDKSHWRSKCPYVMQPNYVVIHNAATTNGTAKSLCTVQNKEAKSDSDLKSWHFSVDEREIWESLPLNRNGFHASDGADGDGNRKGIAIEIARDLDGEEQYYEAAEDNGAKLAAVLLNKYGWDTSHLKTHHDFARDKKWCPHKILDNGWDKFVAKVQGYLDEIQGKTTEQQPVEENPVEDTKPTTEIPTNVTNTETTTLANTFLSLLIELLKTFLSIFTKNKDNIK